jgi:antitoxin component YwqK of YwqJK toxin-antitoxin module
MKRKNEEANNENKKIKIEIDYKQKEDIHYDINIYCFNKLLENFQKQELPIYSGEIKSGFNYDKYLLFQIKNKKIEGLFIEKKIIYGKDLLSFKTFNNSKINGKYYEYIISKYHNSKNEFVNVKSIKNYFDHKGELVNSNNEIIKIVECSYKNNLLNGKYYEYYESGALKLDCNYWYNSLHGEYLRHFDNGNPWVKCNYDTGFIVGKYQKWDNKNNIKKSIIIYYKNGIKGSEYFTE